MPKAREIGRFVLGELRSAAFWGFWGLPIVGTALYSAVAVITGPIGPLVVFGAVATFALGCVGSAALEHRAYLKSIRSSPSNTGRSVPPMVRTGPPSVKRDGPAPVATVEHHDGPEEGVLLVKNTGGDGVFFATGRIVRVFNVDKEMRINHTAPFRMRWRNTSTHQIVKDHKHLIAADDDAKLVLAVKGHRQLSSMRWISIIGDAWEVDSYDAQFDGAQTPAVTIEVELKADPPLLVAYKEQFTILNLRGGTPVLVRPTPEQARR